MILHLNVIFENGNFWEDIEIFPELEIDTFLYDRLILNNEDAPCL